MKTLIAIVVLICGIFTALLVNEFSGEKIRSNGIVLEKHYSSSSTGVGPNTGRGGGVSATFHPPQWVIIAQDRFGYDEIKVDREVYFSLQVGDEITTERVDRRFFGISGIHEINENN